MSYINLNSGANIFVLILIFLNSEQQVTSDGNKCGRFTFFPLNGILNRGSDGQHVVGEGGSNMRK